MKELKEFLGYHPHVQVVYFDKSGNWYIHKNRTIVSEKTRKEILAKGTEGDEGKKGGVDNKSEKK